MPNTFNADGSPDVQSKDDLDYLKGDKVRNRSNYREGILQDVEGVRSRYKTIRGHEPETNTDKGLADVMKANREVDDMYKRERRGK